MKSIGQRVAGVWLAVCLAAPAVAGAVALTGVEIYRLIDPAAPLFGGPAPATLADSITGGYGVEQTYQFIRMGHDPNAAVRVDNDDYVGAEPIDVSPLMLAIAAGDGAAVRMLLSFGVDLDLPQNRHAECLAREMGNPEIQDALRSLRGDAPEPPCTGRRSDAPTPLGAWATF